MNPESVQYFQNLDDIFQTSTQARRIDRWFNLGSYRVRLCFAGSAMVQPLTPAFAHLAIPPQEVADLTICLWDSASTATAMPPPPWTWNEEWAYENNAPTASRLDARGEIRGYSDDRIQTAFHLGSNVLSLLDMQENRALFWIDHAKYLPYYERGSPLRVILHWWMAARSHQYIHGGAVGTPAGGVLLVGKGGSGKSSTALACLDSDLVYASDDYCLVTPKPEPYVYSLYNTAKLKGQADFERFPHLVPLVSNSDQLVTEKALIFLHQHRPEKITSGFPLKAIVLPQVTGQLDTEMYPATTSAALMALAPSTLFQLPGSRRQEFQTMAQLVRQLPCYRLALGTDIQQIPSVIERLLGELIMN